MEVNLNDMYEYIVRPDGIKITNYLGSEKNVTIPSEIDGLPVTHIEDEAFSDKQLIEITIPDTVIHIMRMAFAFNQLTSVSIPNSVTTIGRGAFEDNQLTSVVIPDSVTSIEYSAFENNQLTSVSIPDSVTSIGWWAFSRNQLTDVTIGEIEVSLDIKEENWVDYYREQIEERLTRECLSTIGNWELLD